MVRIFSGSHPNVAFRPGPISTPSFFHCSTWRFDSYSIAAKTRWSSMCLADWPCRECDRNFQLPCPREWGRAPGTQACTPPQQYTCPCVGTVDFTFYKKGNAFRMVLTMRSVFAVSVIPTPAHGFCFVAWCLSSILCASSGAALITQVFRVPVCSLSPCGCPIKKRIVRFPLRSAYQMQATLKNRLSMRAGESALRHGH